MNDSSINEVIFMTKDELEAGLDHIRQSPSDEGVLELVVRRPAEGEREEIEQAELDTAVGLVGDNWSTRPNRHTPDNSPHPEMQLNIMNARSIALITQDKERWKLAGDQLYLDMNLSDENLPPGARLAIGSAIIEVTAIPHNGCKKFMDRFGRDALKFVNSPLGKDLHLRGINAKVVQNGVIRKGDKAKKL